MTQQFPRHLLKRNENIVYKMTCASLVAQLAKNLPAIQKTQVQFLGWKDHLENRVATQSIILV